VPTGLDDFEAEVDLLDELRKAETRNAKQTLRIRGLKRDVRDARAALEDAELRVETYEAATGQKVPTWTTRKRPKKSAATVCALLSDCHFDEIVRFSENGQNAYNREIAEQRLRRFADKVIGLSYDQVQGVDIDGLVLLLGGDLVNGSLHDASEHNETPYMPLTVAHWAGQLAACIDRLAEAFPRVHVVSVVGNHGRLTMKPRTAGRARDSWDWLLVHSARQLVSDDTITWQIPESHDALVEVYGTTILLTHGDSVKGGGGIGGIWPPIKRLQARLQVHKPHDLLVMGHWHQLTMAASAGLIVNGSLKGWDSYAAIYAFSAEPAQQAWWLVTPTHGVTMEAGVFVEDARAEGWG